MGKTLILLAAFFITFTFSAQSKKIDLNKSMITWTGKKVTGEHVGTIKLQDGSLEFKNGKVVGGSFIVNMASLANTDQTGKDREKLEGQLKSTDFFNVKEYNTSQLVIKSVTETKKDFYTFISELTIKGKTNPLTFDMVVMGNTAIADLTIDRTKYNIKYGYGSFFDDLGDLTIYDDFQLKVLLQF